MNRQERRARARRRKRIDALPQNAQAVLDVLIDMLLRETPTGQAMLSSMEGDLAATRACIHELMDAGLLIIEQTRTGPGEDDVSYAFRPLMPGASAHA
jgi:hypothetical protein